MVNISDAAFSRALIFEFQNESYIWPESVQHRAKSGVIVIRYNVEWFMSVDNAKESACLHILICTLQRYCKDMCFALVGGPTTFSVIVGKVNDFYRHRSQDRGRFAS